MEIFYLHLLRKYSTFKSAVMRKTGTEKDHKKLKQNGPDRLW